MKIITTIYFVIGIVIAAAALNLFILYQTEQIGISQSYSIIKAGDLKVKAEAISALSISVANGNLEDKKLLESEKNDFVIILNMLKNGGTLNDQQIEKIPTSIQNQFTDLENAWNDFEQRTTLVEKTMVFDPEATQAVNYVLEKNGELILLSDSLIKQIESLDRDYNRHKQIANDLLTYAQKIGQQTLLISIGESESTDELKINTLKFEVGMRKLLQEDTNNLDLSSIGEVPENIIPIPRENSLALRDLDPLWEAIKLKISILEEKPLLSPNYNDAKNSMTQSKQMFFDKNNILLEKWNEEIRKDTNQKQIIVQILLVVDIVLFIVVIIIIKQSLNPLDVITHALSRVKEGVYGEKIQYNADNEIGNLVKTFNTMSNTIQQKEFETKKADTAKDEFLAMITHELKTPLVPIQGYVDLLISEHLGKLNERQKERLSIIKSSSENLLDIISDLLDAQKLELGQLRMIKENKDISETINNAIKILAPKLAENKIELKVNVQSIFVNHDQDRINQVLTNLLKNAINAVIGRKGIIEISSEDLGNAVRINIKDNGIGIPIEKQNQLFKKFYQVDASLTRERGGSGLGLAICKGIIESHGGEIAVQSTTQYGSTFSFTIPKNTPTKSPLGY